MEHRTRDTSGFSGNGMRRIIVLFLAWKAFLLVVAWASPGVGYDTSTRILFDQYSAPVGWSGRVIESAVLRLTRWDGIYFGALAERGHVNEQDWAFSWFLARCNNLLARGARVPSSLCLSKVEGSSVLTCLLVIFASLPISQIVKSALCGIVISNVAHLLAVLVLYRLTVELLPSSASSRYPVAFTAAILHIISPAGLFLSAPAGESACALFNFAGTLSYIQAFKLRRLPQRLSQEVLCNISAGLLFAIAAAIRSNGLLSGALFAWDAIEGVLQLRTKTLDMKAFTRLAAIGMAGVLVAIGYAAPQAVAYREYCRGPNPRMWCERIPPSIYSWVQEHYWGVGFLRYWTLNNAPLFLLAAPMLGVLLITGGLALLQPCAFSQSYLAKNGRRTQGNQEEKHMEQILQRIAIPQLILAIMAAVSFHVQIINRISSGYPLWYIALAICLCAFQERLRNRDIPAKRTKSTGAKSNGSLLLHILRPSSLPWIVRGMVVYAIVQGGLYACFLPPA